MLQHESHAPSPPRAADPVSGFSGGAGLCLLICVAVFAVAKTGAFNTVTAFKLGIAVLLVCTPLSLLLAVFGLIVALAQGKRIGISIGTFLATLTWGFAFLKLISG